MSNEDDRQQRELLILIKEVNDLDALMNILTKGIPSVGKITNTQVQEKTDPEGRGNDGPKKINAKADPKGKIFYLMFPTK